MEIRLFEPWNLDGVLRLSLRAWAPVFVSIEQRMAPGVFQRFFPDWRAEQRSAVAAVCSNPQARVWVAERAESWMRENGVVVAMVETGGDPGHAPARRLYESQEFRLWPVARYYKRLA